MINVTAFLEHKSGGRLKSRSPSPAALGVSLRIFDFQGIFPCSRWQAGSDPWGLAGTPATTIQGWSGSPKVECTLPHPPLCSQQYSQRSKKLFAPKASPKLLHHIFSSAPGTSTSQCHRGSGPGGAGAAFPWGQRGCPKGVQSL